MTGRSVAASVDNAAAMCSPRWPGFDRT
jgi:hypothetical protein